MKKLTLSVFCCTLLFTSCSSKVQEKGKMRQAGIKDAFSKMDKKETFLSMTARDEYYYYQLIHKILDDTIGNYPTTIYNVKMDDSTTENPCVDNNLLETRLEKPGTTLHVCCTKGGMVEDDIIGFDEGNPLELWEWIKKYNIENLRQKQEDEKTFISRSRISLYPGIERDQFHRLEIMGLILPHPGHYDFTHFQVGIRQGVFFYVMCPTQIL